MRTFGSSTEVRPLDTVYLTDRLDPDTLADFQRRRRLEVERLLSGEQPARGNPPVVVITSGIHPTEIGGPQCMPELLLWLARSPAAASIRERVLTIVIPTLNPDGFDLVTRWPTETLGTELAGS